MMSRKISSTILLVASVTLLASCHKVNPNNPSNSDGSESGSTPSGPKVTITVDGGGDISDFNTTASMVKSDSNPFPYNTLETLCKEWEALNPNYTVKINKTSAHGDRSVLLPQLISKQSCDIIYQNGNVINSDLGKDYYADLTPYLEKPNPYNDNKPWKEVYNEGELASTQASDGKYYYVNLEKIPVCLVYNKNILTAAGVSDPQGIDTFGKLMDAMDKVEEYYKAKGFTDGTYATYSTTYTWYQLAMETNVFSDLVEPGDVIRKNNIVDTEELCRLYDKGLYNPNSGIDSANPSASTFENNKFYDMIKLMCELEGHLAPLSYHATQGWVTGKLAFMEATGQHLRTYDSLIDGFEWGTIPFPDITKDDYSKAGVGVVRGSAGLATSWWISNAAMAANKTDACADLLMYLTSPKQNNRLIGDLKGGIPLNPGSDYQLADYLKPLVEQYDKDIAEVSKGNRVLWTALSARSVLGNNYSDLFIRTMHDVDNGVNTPEEATIILARAIKNTITSLIMEFDYHWDD